MIDIQSPLYTFTIKLWPIYQRWCENSFVDAQRPSFVSLDEIDFFVRWFALILLDVASILFLSNVQWLYLSDLKIMVSKLVMI